MMFLDIAGLAKMKATNADQEAMRIAKAYRIVKMLNADGMTVSEACKQAGITENVFYAIKKKARR